MDCSIKDLTANERLDLASHMPSTEHRAPSTEHRAPSTEHRSTGAHRTHLFDNESPPGPRRPVESSPPVAGGSSSPSNERAPRLSAALLHEYPLRVGRFGPHFS